MPENRAEKLVEQANELLKTAGRRALIVPAHRAEELRRAERLVEEANALMGDQEVLVLAEERAKALEHQMFLEQEASKIRVIDRSGERVV